jgi:LysR family transcriptional regulator, nitrogen assimilation regulatory protein
MDLRQITYFTWVYDEESFTTAAEKARVVQSTLSMQIKNLEAELGVRLFERARSGVRPTRAGTRLYKHCLVITRELALARAALTELKPGEQVAGNIAVGIPPVLSQGVIAPTLLEIFETYPEVNVVVREAYTGTVVEWVREGKVDFALGALPSKGPGLMQRLIYRDTVALISGRRLNGANHTPCDLTKLKGLKLIIPSSKHSFASFIRKCIDDGTIVPEKVLEMDGYVSGMELPRVSDWVSLLPSGALSGKKEGLYVYPVAKPRIPFNVYLVYDQRRPLTAAAMRFIEVITRHLRQRAKPSLA